ncbi:MAG: sugar transferase [Sedimentibacter saalensis]|uniref:sugar transferase n=1 Tax=Sedimentibacter saalensis TaxID=130788 RepID=UPI002B21598E|nr:sugar transferase [Sedimentibacter saalensis]MEA5093484.1 sugar transferase [Sedimentibacter saalensis]
MYKKCIKRLLSIIISFFGLVLLFPFMIILAVFIRLDSKGEAIFKQKRLGRKQKEFTIYKFRTMVENAYKIGGANSYEGDPRITKVGALLRKTSLDEIPQLINIFKGEMSIIGPRPILKEEFEPYKSNAYYSKRYDVRPGLFCTVDVDYRAVATRELQFEMDAEYVDNMSVKLDVDLFLKTFITVIQRKNVYRQEEEDSAEGSR